MAFWEYLPKSVYAAWKGNKFAKKAQDVIDRVVELPEGGAEALGEAKEGAEDVLGGAWKQFSRAQRWQERNIQDPLVGVTELAGSPYTTLSPLSGGLANLPTAARRAGDAWGQLLEEGPSRETFGDITRESEAGGVERFVQRQVVDPLTYVGGIGKAVGTLPKLGKVGAAISAVEKVPARAEQAVAKGITAVGSAPLRKAGFLEPSVTGAARRTSNEVFDLARRGAIDPDKLSAEEANRVLHSMGKSGRYGMEAEARQPVEVQRALHGILDPHGVRQGSQKAAELWTPQEALRRAVGKDDPVKVAEAARQRSFMQHVDETRKAIRERRTAAKEAGGVGGVKARVQEGIDTLYTGVKVGDGFEISPAGINRMASLAALGTPAYPAGSAAEDLIRAVVGGGSGRALGAKAFAKEIGDAPMPVPELFTGGQTARLLDTKAASTAKNPFVRHASNLLTGRTFTQVADKATTPRRAGFVADRLRHYQEQGLDSAQAAARAIEDFKREFPNYLDETRLDAAMKSLIPFWGYQKTAYPYLARKAAELPGAAKAAANYYEQTDEGHLQIAPDWQLNPFKGSVLNRVAGLNKPFYPTYAQGPSGLIEQGQNLLARAGFYPGAATEAALAAGRFVQGEPVEPGSFIPGPVAVPLQLVGALGARTDIPGVEQVAQAADNLQDVFFDDRFRQYYIAKELAAMGIEPDMATPEQRAEAEQRTDLRLAMLTELGVLRWRPEAERDYREQQIQAAIAAGVPEEQARALSETGNPLSAADAEGTRLLDAATVREIYAENPQWAPWRQATEPLKRPEQRQSLQETRGYFDRLDEIDRMQVEGIRDAEGRLVQAGLAQLYQAYEAGVISGTQLREQRKNLLRQISAMRAEAKEQFDRRGALTDEAARAAFYKQTGRTLRDTSKDEAARSYYDINVELDPQTGLPDFESFFAQREAALAAMDPATRRYVTEQYPRDRYKEHPGVAAGEEMLKTEMAAFQEYLKMPRYRGIDKEDEAEISAAIELYNFLRQERPRASAASLRAQVAKVYPRGARLMRYTGRLQNPKRDRFLQDRPELRRLLSDVLGTDLDIVLD